MGCMTVYGIGHRIGCGIGCYIMLNLVWFGDRLQIIIRSIVAVYCGIRCEIGSSLGCGLRFRIGNKISQHTYCSCNFYCYIFTSIVVINNRKHMKNRNCRCENTPVTG